MSWTYATKWLAIGASAGVLLVAAWWGLDLLLGGSTVVAGTATLLLGMATATGLIVGAGQIVRRRFWRR